MALPVWRAITLLPIPRGSLAAMLRLDGLIYVIGGADSNGTVSSTIEVYNPLTDKWLFEA
ncbi:MAG TPA: kelch repeat-containing protein [Ktedonobacteraceae bacterium]